MNFTWARIAILLLQIVDKLTDYLREQRYTDQGYDKAIAELNAKILRKSQYAKEALDNISSLSDADVDERLRKLEP